jgi:hypothetical protein
MIHAHLNYLIAQQRGDDARRAAERERFARSIPLDRRGPAATHPIARLRAAVVARYSPTIPESM